MAAGIICTNEALMRRYVEIGFNIVAVDSHRGILVRGADQLVAKYK